MFIDQASSVPKYKQIINTIIEDIKCQRLGYHERLPSINEFSVSNDVSRDTVEKAYRHLKRDGLIISVPGKGYFAAASDVGSERKILLLFNKLSSYKKVIFEEFISAVKSGAAVDLFVYNEELCAFKQILQANSGSYTDYVIIPSFKGQDEIEARSVIQSALKEKRVWVLNTNMPGLENAFGAVYQNYEQDIYGALCEAHTRLEEYNKLILVFPTKSNYSRSIIKGFTRYCLQKEISSDILYKFDRDHCVVPGAAYIVILDEDLALLTKSIKQAGLVPGKDIGVLAYNDSPLKEVLLDGISVMTTDHAAMGRKLARSVLAGERGVIENEFRLVLRNTL